MRLALIALFLLLLLPGFSLAQAEKLPVVIRVIDAADSTVPLIASVAVETKAGVQVWAATFEARDTFWAEPNESYVLKASALQKKPVQLSFNTATSALGMDVRFQGTGSELKSVVVVARRSLMRLDGDKEIVDAEPFANASTNAYEVLEKTPGAVVLDGNIYLNGTTPATVQINGREVKLKGEDVSSLLKSLPANAVVRVEIIRTPSAKYDASSSGGVINIVMKKGIRLGTSGSGNISSFQGQRNTTSAGVSINRSEGDLTSYLGYQYSLRHNLLDLATNRAASSQSVIDQVSHTETEGQNHNLRGGVSWDKTPNTNLSYDGILSYNLNNTDADNTNRIMLMPAETEVARVLTDTRNRYKSLYFSNVFSLTKKLDSLGSSWNSVAEYKINADGGNQRYVSSFPPATAVITGDGTLKNRNHLVTLQSDYTRVFTKGLTLETGIRLDGSFAANRSDFQNDTSGRGFRPNLFQTAHFNFSQEVAAGYIQLSKTFWGFNVKPGLRVEHTRMNGEQVYPLVSDFQVRRTDFFPFLYIRRNLWKMFGTPLIATASYRKSIERPTFDLLNPAPRYVDQFLYDRGNPALLPQLTYKYELNVTMFDFPVFAIGHRDNQNLFTGVNYQDTTTGIAYRTYDNLGRNREFFLRLVGGIPPTVGRYFFFVSAEYTKRRFEGQYQDVPFNFTRGSWTLFTYHNVKLTKTLNFAAHGFWLINGFDRFYELQNFGAINCSLTKNWLDAKLTTVLAVNDLLRTNRQEFLLSQPGIYATGTRAEDTRRVGVTVRYNFGVKPKQRSSNPMDYLNGSNQ